MYVAIVGPGRLGRSLATLLGRRGVRTVLVGRGQVVPTDVHGVLLTVPDGAIAEVARSLPAMPVVLHCSGACTVDPLRPHAPAGSLHPLMTFPGPEVRLPTLDGVGAALAGDPEAIAFARALCARLGLVPFIVPGDRRLYHAAAVIAGNFATVLLAEATRALVAAGVPPDHAASRLAPLAHASIDGALPDPARGLTGPAARGDSATIAGHRAALAEAGLTDLGDLYDALSRRAAGLASSIRDER